MLRVIIYMPVIPSLQKLHESGQAYNHLFGHLHLTLNMGPRDEMGHRIKTRTEELGSISRETIPRTDVTLHVVTTMRIPWYKYTMEIKK